MTGDIKSGKVPDVFVLSIRLFNIVSSEFFCYLIPCYIPALAPELLSPQTAQILCHPRFLLHRASSLCPTSVFFPLILLFCTPSYFIFHRSTKISVSFTWFPGRCFTPYMDSVRYILLLPHFSGEAEGHTHTAHAALEPVTPGTRIQTQTLVHLLARNPSSVMVEHGEMAYAFCRNERSEQD